MSEKNKKDRDNTNNESVKREPAPMCYHENKAYSSGAKVCQSGSLMECFVTGPNAEWQKIGDC